MALAKLLTFSLLAASIGYWVLCIIGALKFLSRRPDERAEGAPPATILSRSGGSTLTWQTTVAPSAARTIRSTR